MNAQIRAVIIGLGIHGKDIARGIVEAGIDLVAGVDLAYTDHDLGELLGLSGLTSKPVGANLTDIDWDDVDVTIIAAKLDVPSLVDLSKEVIRNESNVITIVEDAFDLESAAPELHATLHQVALKHDKTFIATGVQDIAWTHTVAQMSGAQRQLQSIRISQHLGVDGYPRDFLEWVGIGLSAEQFKRAAPKALEEPSVLGAALPVLAKHLRLNIINIDRSIEAFTRPGPIASQTLERTIAPGEPAGRRDVTTVHTDEGITLSAELVTSAINGEDNFSATLEGDPEITLNHRLDPGPSAVNGTAINRIPDVIQAPPGVLSTTNLASPRYHHRLRKLASNSVTSSAANAPVTT